MQPASQSRNLSLQFLPEQPCTWMLLDLLKPLQRTGSIDGPVSGEFIRHPERPPNLDAPIPRKTMEPLVTGHEDALGLLCRRQGEVVDADIPGIPARRA